MELNFEYENVKLDFEITQDRIVRKPRQDFVCADTERAQSLAEICEVQIRGRMTRGHMGARHLQSSESGRFRYVAHAIEKGERGALLTITQRSDLAELRSFFFVPKGTGTLRTWHEIENIGAQPFTLEYIGTYGELMMTEPKTFGETEFWLPTNGSYCECQWSRAPLSVYGVFGGHNMKSQKKLCISNTGAWSTKTYLPMGAVKDRNGAFTMWQIEANGSWSYELSDLYDSLTLHLNGPTFEEHNWQKTLKPGERFETVKAAVTRGRSFNEAAANMTAYRRAIVVNNRLAAPVVFNEYMYASWNTPSEKTAYALAPVAKRFGADYYVIDCGWHDEEPDPFYYLGRWEESASRYPGGLKKTLDFIRAQGLVPGLWMEPEAVGAKGDAAKLYEEDAYFSRGGAVLGISERYQLDFRNEKVFSRLEKIVGKLVEDYGVGYLKLDYNIEPGVGTDRNAESCGDGLLEHNRAYLRWVCRLREKYPSLVIENCASGGNRMDYLTLANCDLQSTSDQIDYRVYPYIAANMFSVLLPEQAAVWAYPASHVDEAQPDRECVIMNMINGLAGRMHLASRLNLLNEENGALVREACEFSHEIDGFRKKALPWFHKDLPAEMDAGQVVFGMREGGRLLVFAYRMHGEEKICIDAGREIGSAAVVYPKDSQIGLSVNGGTLSMKFPQPYMARVIEIRFK